MSTYSGPPNRGGFEKTRSDLSKASDFVIGMTARRVSALATRCTRAIRLEELRPSWKLRRPVSPSKIGGPYADWGGQPKLRQSGRGHAHMCTSDRRGRVLIVITPTTSSHDFLFFDCIQAAPILPRHYSDENQVEKAIPLLGTYIVRATVKCRTC